MTPDRTDQKYSKGIKSALAFLLTLNGWSTLSNMFPTKLEVHPKLEYMPTWDREGKLAQM